MSEILDKSVEQHYLCKECLKTLSARTDIVEEGHTLSHQLKRSVLHMAREGITATGIARICHCSPSSVIRIIDEAVELKLRVARLPENLCFDEFRSVNSTMSFICCDAEGSHDIVAILENRLTKTIREHFMNRYTNRERAAVKSVVVDLNAQYIKFIKALFPNALDLIVKNHPQFERVYNAYQDVFNALKGKKQGEAH